jgi:hypothetical protein
MEIVRNIRDSSINQISQDWNTLFGNFCDNNNIFWTRYDETVNRYNIQPLTEPRSVSDPNGFTFQWYLECREIERVGLDILPLPLPFTDPGKPIRVRIVITWNEYGQEKTYWLNQYLTDLGLT